MALAGTVEGLQPGGRLPDEAVLPPAGLHDLGYAVTLQVVNHMAAQTLILNQDRCTKNFYIYLDPTSQQWSFLPWDLKSGGPSVLKLLQHSSPSLPAEQIPARPL